MSNVLRIRQNTKEEILINQPTQVDTEIFRIFESYQNFNSNRNSLIGGFHKKNKFKKNNNNNLNSNLLITSSTNFFSSNSGGNGFTGNMPSIEDNGENSDKNKKFNITNEQKGLDDNYINDLENKRKAKLGLLMIMHKYSGGHFCKEVKAYFDQIQKSQQEKIKKETHKEEDIMVKKTFERQKCLESFDNKDLPRLHTDKQQLSDRLSKNNSEYDFKQNKNKQHFNNIKPQYKNKLPKIVEENNDFNFRKKFKEDLNEDQLANLYYSVEEIEKQNNNFISGRKTKKIKIEEIKNMLNNMKSDFNGINNNNNINNNATGNVNYPKDTHAHLQPNTQQNNNLAINNKSATSRLKQFVQSSKSSSLLYKKASTKKLISNPSFLAQLQASALPNDNFEDHPKIIKLQSNFLPQNNEAVTKLPKKLSSKNSNEVNKNKSQISDGY